MYLLNCLFNWWTQIQQILTSPRPKGGGGDASPADSGAHASARLLGGGSRGQLPVHLLCCLFVGTVCSLPTFCILVSCLSFYFLGPVLWKFFKSLYQYSCSCFLLVFYFTCPPPLPVCLFAKNTMVLICSLLFK